MIKSNIRLLQTLNVSAYLVMILVNALANTIRLNGYTTGEVSARYPTLLTPAGFSFSIWSLIYALLLLFVLYQANIIFKDQQKKIGLVVTIGYAFIVSCLANVAWIVTWHYQRFDLNILAMALLLAALIDLYRRIFKYGKASEKILLPFKWLVKVPFEIYLSWISVASAVNAAVYLQQSQWGGYGLGEEIWASVLVSFLVALALWFGLKFKTLAFAITIAWGIVGIFYSSTQMNNYQTLQRTCVSALVILILFIVLFQFRKILLKPLRPKHYGMRNLPTDE